MEISIIKKGEPYIQDIPVSSKTFINDHEVSHITLNVNAESAVIVFKDNNWEAVQLSEKVFAPLKQEIKPHLVRKVLAEVSHKYHLKKKEQIENKIHRLGLQVINKESWKNGVFSFLLKLFCLSGVFRRKMDRSIERTQAELGKLQNEKNEIAKELNLKKPETILKLRNPFKESAEKAFEKIKSASKEPSLLTWVEILEKARKEIKATESKRHKSMGPKETLVLEAMHNLAKLSKIKMPSEDREMFKKQILGSLEMEKIVDLQRAKNIYFLGWKEKA